MFRYYLGDSGRRILLNMEGDFLLRVEDFGIIDLVGFLVKLFFRREDLGVKVSFI